MSVKNVENSERAKLNKAFIQTVKFRLDTQLRQGGEVIRTVKVWGNTF